MVRPGGRYSQVNSGDLRILEGQRKSREAADRALTLDPNLAEAHSIDAAIKTAHEWDWAGAEAAVQRALALEPGNAVALIRAATLAANLGRVDEALQLGRRAAGQDPLRPATWQNLGFIAGPSGKWEESTAALRKALELTPGRPAIHGQLGRFLLAQSRPQEALAEIEQEPSPLWRLYGLALIYHALGRKKEADAALAEFIAKYQSDGPYQIAAIYAFRGETDRAFEWLERAYVQRDGGVSEMKGDFFLKNIERDPRYAAFLKKMRLPV